MALNNHREVHLSSQITSNNGRTKDSLKTASSSVESGAEGPFGGSDSPAEY